jgi:hypothetical protein
MPIIARILIICLLYYLIFRVFRGLIVTKRGNDNIIDFGELVKDSLTGVYFLKTNAIILNKDGQKLYFSSIANRDQWLHQENQNH